MKIEKQFKYLKVYTLGETDYDCNNEVCIWNNNNNF